MNIGVKHVIVIVAAIFLVGAGYWYIQNRSLQGVNQLDPNQVTELIEQVGEYAVVPEGIDASQVRVAAVQDAETLKKASPFFQDAQNGDQLLMFPNKLILFRPSEKKVVNMSAPAGLQTPTTTVTNVATTAVDPTTEPGQQTIPTESLTIEIRNGSGVTGLASKYKASITQVLKRVTVSKTGNAANENYTTTMIINLKGKIISDLENVFTTKNVSTTLPEGEAASTADVIVILGKSSE